MDKTSHGLMVSSSGYEKCIKKPLRRQIVHCGFGTRRSHWKLRRREVIEVLQWEANTEQISDTCPNVDSGYGARTSLVQN
jgi:hypothetical protein